MVLQRLVHLRAGLQEWDRCCSLVAEVGGYSLVEHSSGFGGEGIGNLFDDQRKLGSNTPSYGFEEIDLDEGWGLT